MKRKIILASTSPKRKELLLKTGLKFEVASSDYEEDMTLKLIPAELAKFLSKGKAEAVANKYRDAIILAADTFICFEGEIIGKPHTEDRAYISLRKLSGQTHSVFTGYTIIDTKNQKTISKAIETKITFKKLSDELIWHYVKNGNPLKYAGAYTLGDVTDIFLEKIEGDYGNVIGLPVTDVLVSLKEFGVEIA